MSRENQIEEMAKDIACKIAWDEDEIPTVNCLETAKRLYCEGYRKSTDVAEEIFAELDTFIVTKVIDHGTLKYDIGDKYKALKQKYSVALPTIAELKKKYTEEGK